MMLSAEEIKQQNCSNVYIIVLMDNFGISLSPHLIQDFREKSINRIKCTICLKNQCANVPDFYGEMSSTQ